MTRILQAFARSIAGRFGRQSWIVRSLRPMYVRLLDCLSFGKGIPWDINGVTFRIDPRCRGQMGSNYDSEVAAFFKMRVRPGQCIINVGANVGIYVLQFANWSAPDGSVVAFEPNPTTRTKLQKHIQLNGFVHRVTVEPYAVGGALGEQTLYAAGTEGMSRLATPNSLLEGKTVPIRVPVTTLDSYVESTGLKPDWVFMDIEGFEIVALSAAKSLLGELGTEFLVEFHPDVWDSTGVSRDAAKQLFESLGVAPEPLTGQSDALADYGIVWLRRVDSK